MAKRLWCNPEICFEKKSVQDCGEVWSRVSKLYLNYLFLQTLAANRTSASQSCFVSRQSSNDEDLVGSFKIFRTFS